MKSNKLKWLCLLFVTVFSTLGSMAQVGTLDQIGNQTVCIGSIEDYGVVNIAGSTYVWSIAGGPGFGTIIGNSNLIQVNWTIEGACTLQVIERNAQGCYGEPLPISITVNPLPTATIGGSLAVCQNGTAPDITFTGTGGIAPYTFTYTLNEGSPLTVVTTSGNSITVSAPTTVVGSFIYTLTGVQDASGSSCSQAQTGIATIIVNPLPTATIAGTLEVCQNGTVPDITFTGAGGTAPYTFTYTLNGGKPLTVLTTSGNSVTVSAPITVAGTFIYALTGVQDASSSFCLQEQSGSATIIVNPLPTATIAGTFAVCQTGTAPDITFTGAGGSAPYTFSYTLNGGPTQTIATTSGNTVSLSAPTLSVGTFIYELTSLQDASGTSCSQAQTGSATITINLLPTTSVIYHN